MVHLCLDAYKRKYAYGSAFWNNSHRNETNGRDKIHERYKKYKPNSVVKMLLEEQPTTLISGVMILYCNNNKFVDIPVSLPRLVEMVKAKIQPLKEDTPLCLKEIFILSNDNENSVEFSCNYNWDDGYRGSSRYNTPYSKLFGKDFKLIEYQYVI